MSTLPHCARCAPYLHKEAAEYPGKVDLDSPVLKEDLANLVRAIERCSSVPDAVADALASAKKHRDHVQALDVLVSALMQQEKLPESVALVFNDTYHHFGLVHRDEPTQGLFIHVRKVPQ